MYNKNRLRQDQVRAALLTGPVTQPFCSSKPASLFKLSWWRESRRWRSGHADDFDVISNVFFSANTPIGKPRLLLLTLSLSHLVKICKHTHISILLPSQSAHLHLHFAHLAAALILNLHLDSVMCLVYYLNLLRMAVIPKPICSAEPFWKG